MIRGLEVITVTPGIQAERSSAPIRGALIYRITAEVSEPPGSRRATWSPSSTGAISSAAQITSLLESMRSGEVFRIVFERQGATLTTTLAFR
ncbi:MAG: hypothetical protein R2909_07285 [Gemmatimonadales bacterium]